MQENVVYAGIPDVDYPSNGKDFFDWFIEAKPVDKMILVAAYMSRHMDPDTGYIYATQKQIQQATKLSAPTVAKSIKRLQGCWPLTKVRNGVWHIDFEPYKVKDDCEEGYSFIRHVTDPTRL